MESFEEGSPYYEHVKHREIMAMAEDTVILNKHQNICALLKCFFNCITATIRDSGKRERGYFGIRKIVKEDQKRMVPFKLGNLASMIPSIMALSNNGTTKILTRTTTFTVDSKRIKVEAIISSSAWQLQVSGIDVKMKNYLFSKLKRKTLIINLKMS